MVDRRKDTYLRALHAQTRRLGDYEQIHFRKSWAVAAYETVRGNDSLTSYSRPVLQPQVLEFSRATAKPYLQQTESLWLKLDLSRQNATEELFDKKTGSFYVRSSSKSKYALSVRLDDDQNPVMHYLIYCNAQGFYGIQGSNLQFVSLYDLLAYFCFQQSGGMPCLLSPPTMHQKRGFYISDSESDSEEEDEDDNIFSPESEHPPSAPFKKPPLGVRNSLPIASVPPPLPPRRQKLLRSSNQSDGSDHINIINRPTSLIDNDRDQPIPSVPHYEMQHPLSTHTTTASNKDYEMTVPMRGYKNFEILSDKRPLEDPLVSSSYKSLVILSDHQQHEPHPTRPPKIDTHSDNDIPPALPPRPAPPPPVPPRTRRYTENPANKEPKPVDMSTTATTSSSSLRRTHRRAASDSSIVSGASEEIELQTLSSPIPPPVPPKAKEKRLLDPPSFGANTDPLSRKEKENREFVLPREEEQEEEKEDPLSGKDKDHQPSEEHVKIDNINDIVNDEMEGWTMVESINESSQFTASTVSTSGGGGGGKSKKKKNRWTKRLKKWRRKPRGRIKHYILDLAEDRNSIFGSRVHYFLESILMKGSDPHQKLLSDVRQFLSRMRELLLDEHRVELLSHGMDSCHNFEHLLEATLQQCITLPLHKFLFDKLKENLTSTGSYGQLEEAVENAKTKSPEDLGIRPHLLVPNDKSLSEIKSIFDKLKQTHCAMRKMEYLLEAVRLTYEGVKDVNNPKKVMNDLGADDFLPLFVWVLAQSNFVTAEIEAEYIWGLAHPSLFNGEGGYYLTTLTSAVNVLRELCSETYNQECSKQLPKTSSLKSELQIYTCISSEPNIPPKLDGPFSVPVLPTMSAAEICELVAIRFNITNHEEYSIFTHIGEQVTPLKATDYPQEITIDWELQDSSTEDTDGSTAVTTDDNNIKRLLVFMKTTDSNR